MDRQAHGTDEAQRAQRVLVVDDDAAVGNAIRRVLLPDAVTFAQSTAGALARVAAAGESFKAIVCDMHMPAMSGVEFQEEVRRIAPDLAERIVFVTGGAQNAEVAAFLERTTSPWLMKPFDREGLRAAIDAVARRLEP